MPCAAEALLIFPLHLGIHIPQRCSVRTKMWHTLSLFVFSCARGNRTTVFQYLRVRHLSFTFEALTMVLSSNVDSLKAFLRIEQVKTKVFFLGRLRRHSNSLYTEHRTWRSGQGGKTYGGEVQSDMAAIKKAESSHEVDSRECSLAEGFHSGYPGPVESCQAVGNTVPPAPVLHMPCIDKESKVSLIS